MQKESLNREELFYLFWTQSEFSEMRNEMVAYVKRKVPGITTDDAKEAVNNTIYQVASDCYFTLDSIKSGDWLGLLRNSYFQKQFNACRLQSNGKTIAEEEHEKNVNIKAKRDAKKKKKGKIYLAIAIIGILYYIVAFAIQYFKK